MLLKFTKMHGCGNDYIYVNGFTQIMPHPQKAAVQLSRRHFSIGADGLIIICPSDIADAKMRMFNADGSEGKMCGNGIRCVAKYVYDNGISKNNPLKIETLSGIKTVSLTVENDVVTHASVDMGAPILTPADIPAKAVGKLPVINREISFGDKSFLVTLVSMGNPHCVIFVPEEFDLGGFDIEKDGSLIENAPVFPEKANVEFVKMHSQTLFEMRVWERGSGETLACGTGACAVAVAAVLNGYAQKNTDICIRLKGGDLTVRYTGDTVIMTGEACEAFSGFVQL